MERQVDDDIAQLVAARDSLHASLGKSREVSYLLHERLQNFQERLSLIRRNAAPANEESKSTMELSRRIDKASQSITSFRKLYNVFHDLRTIIMGDLSLDLNGYLAGVMQLEEALDYYRHEFAAAISCLQEAVNFLETTSTHSLRLRNILRNLQAEQAGDKFNGDLLIVAQKKLENEFSRLLAENCLPVSLPTQMGPQTEDAPFSSTELEYLFGFPSEALQKLQVIITRLAGTEHYSRCLKEYQERRSAQCRQSLEALEVEYSRISASELIDKVTWIDLQNIIKKWTQQLEVVVKVLYAGERRLARQVFKDMGQPVWVECLNYVAQPGMSAFFQFGESFSTTSRSPEKLCNLLEMLEGMEKSEHSVIQVFDGQACCGIRKRYRELLKQVTYGAFKAFWDMSEWVEEQKEPQIHDGGVMRLCSFVVNYLDYLVRDYLEPMSKALRCQKNRQGDGGPPETSLAQGILLIFQALGRQIEARAKEVPDPALRHIFMMNNLQYIYTRVEKNRLKDFLDASWIYGIGRKVDNHTLKYQNDFCQKIVIHLNHEGLGGSSIGKSSVRSIVRQNLRAFSSAFDDIIRTQGNWVIQHESLRDSTRSYITRKILSVYRSYLENYGHLLGHFYSSNKFVKYTPEMVEQLLDGVFVPKRRSSSTLSLSNDS